ncbi:MAG: corrinoid protein [Bacteroidaceae bacterium]|nr:corrinoid protein [Bacteroidaceae bacterium]
MMELEKLTDAIVAGNLNDAVALSGQAVEAGIEPKVIISDYLIKGMEIIGARFGEGKAFVPNLLMSARAMKGCLDLLKPMMKGDTSISYGKVVIGTVKGDLHDIGKNLVASMFEGSGFEVVNLGINVDADKFVKAVIDNKADILALSALLTTTMGYMKDVIKAVEDAGIRNNVKIMVGGAPVNANFANEIGADIYTTDANEAVVVAKQILGKAS